MHILSVDRNILLLAVSSFALSARSSTDLSERSERAGLRAEHEFKVSKYSPEAFADATNLEETSNVAPLIRGERRSRSSQYTYALRTGQSVHNAPITSLFGGSEFLLPIQFGGQSFFTIMDTGSSNIWVARKGFACVDSKGKKIAERNCNFGPLYKTTNRFRQIANQNFNSTYASGEGLVGVPGYETVTLGGVTVHKQEIGVIDYAFWSGDGKSSSLLGLAYPVVTSTFRGNDPSKDKPYQRINYNPLFTNMYQKGLVKPVFSVELGRNGKPGRLALGGIPSGYDPNTVFASAPIQIVNLTHFGSATKYSFYTVVIDGFVVANSSSKERQFIKAGPTSTRNLDDRGVVKADYPAIVDSGTTLNYVTGEVARAIVSQFEPAGYYQDGYWYVDCLAVKPLVGVVIGGREFYVRPEQLSYNFGGGRCISGFQGVIREDPVLHVLGDAFLQSVLAVFDVGASEMRFAQR